MSLRRSSTSAGSARFVDQGAFPRAHGWGNPSPAHPSRTPSGMINAIGLQKYGCPRFLWRQKMPRFAPALVRRDKGKGGDHRQTSLGFTIKDCVEVIHVPERLPRISRSMKLNASCPNTAHGRHGCSEPTRGLLAETCRPLGCNCCASAGGESLSPNVTSIAQMARTAEAAGAKAISLVNTFFYHSPLIRRRRRPTQSRMLPEAYLARRSSPSPSAWSMRLQRWLRFPFSGWAAS